MQSMESRVEEGERVRTRSEPHLGLDLMVWGGLTQVGQVLSVGEAELVEGGQCLSVQNGENRLRGRLDDGCLLPLRE